jgi:hypothetical protein
VNDNIKDSDIEIIEDWLRNIRPDEEMRPKLDYTYLLERNTFILCEIRPNWKTMKDWQKLPFSKIHYLELADVYKIYWPRANGRWLNYDPKKETKTLEDALKTINEDAFGCFFG